MTGSISNLLSIRSVPLRRLPGSCARILLQSLKKLKHTGFMIRISMIAFFTMQKTSVFIGFIVKKTNACHKIELCGVKCASCPTCNQTCPDFEREHCSHLQHAPYVCNGCGKKGMQCTIAIRYRYNARIADREYKERLLAHWILRGLLSVQQKQIFR